MGARGGAAKLNQTIFNSIIHEDTLPLSLKLSFSNSWWLSSSLFFFSVFGVLDSLFVDVRVDDCTIFFGVLAADSKNRYYESVTKTCKTDALIKARVQLGKITVFHSIHQNNDFISKM